MGLGHQAQDRSFLDNCGAIIQFVVDPHRQTHCRHHFQVPGGLQHGGKGLLRTPEKGVLVEQVAAAVSGQSQFRQHQHLHAGLLRLAHDGKRLFRVIIAVRQAQLGRTAGHGDETVSHSAKPPVESFDGCILHRRHPFDKDPAQTAQEEFLSQLSSFP